MKWALTFVFAVSLVGCATRNTQTLITESEAIEMAEAFTRQEKWTVLNRWSNVTHGKGEWGVLFDVAGHGCPKVVYVNERTRRIRFVQGTIFGAQ